MAGGASNRLGRRLVEWFWRADALAAARLARAAEARQVAHERARVTAEVAQQILAPPGPRLVTRAHHLAAALFLESIGWALRALAPASADESEPRYAFDGPPQPAELAQLFARQERVLLQATSSRQALEQLRAHAFKREFEHTTRLADENERAARMLSNVALRLLGSLSQAQRSIDTLMLQRTLRTFGLPAAAVLLALGFVLAGDRLERSADLALHKPWRASSSYESVCQSPDRNCRPEKSYFFHTQKEASPWLELDLLSEQQFSGAHVFNREDCCQERAVPLLIEVSSDHQAWREVIRQPQSFDDWQPRFATVSARWVRFRIAQASFLHLREVRILR